MIKNWFNSFIIIQFEEKLINFLVDDGLIESYSKKLKNNFVLVAIISTNNRNHFHGLKVPAPAAVCILPQFIGNTFEGRWNLIFEILAHLRITSWGVRFNFQRYFAIFHFRPSWQNIRWNNELLHRTALYRWENF